MGEIKESVGKVMNMTEEESTHQLETMRQFKAFISSTLKEGVLDTKTKKLIVVETVITVRYTFCIMIHVEKTLKAGVKKEEIFDMAVIAIRMGGGSAMT